MSVHQKMILTKDGKMITAKKLKKNAKNESDFCNEG